MDLTKFGYRILKTLSGSYAYGTNVEGSDKDYKGLFIPKKEYIIGPLKNVEQVEESTSHGHEYDQVHYALPKFIELAVNSNPNIIELLYTDERNISLQTEEYKKLRDNHDLFLSKRAYKAFSGYALAQLKRVETHRKWLLDPPSRQPTREDYKLPLDRKLDINALQVLIDEGYEFSSAVMITIEREKNYKNALAHYNQYQDWKKKRNPKRAELEAKSGYDLKHAYHLYRLLSMATEILSKGEVIVYRPDRETILAIRDGQWSYEQLIEWAEKKDKENHELYLKSSLQEHPDLERINNLSIELIEECWEKQNVK